MYFSIYIMAIAISRLDRNLHPNHPVIVGNSR
jgi:hypothetical protein